MYYVSNKYCVVIYTRLYYTKLFSFYTKDTLSLRLYYVNTIVKKELSFYNNDD